ncbi:MAG: UvrD-helicase domain-containing protein, partial [Lachnospiraceae bacterium]|nr:UvrD-helicase domain-containing protein [Lachnospiraceae bacterium]
MNDIYESLNDKQREAVTHCDGPLLILAGAGSGKTRVLTHRVAYLIAEKGVNPWNIMAITFTNKAAQEMRSRVDRLVEYGAESIWVATFHASCARILRRFADRLGYDNNFTIYDTDDQKSLMKEVCKYLQIDTKQLKERTILNAISSAKNELINETEYANISYGDYSNTRIANAYKEYQSRLKKNNAMDFDDLIMNTVALFTSQPDVLASYQERFSYVCVDEYQDTNTAQFKLVSLLAGGKRNLCVVGDDDQSIYRFRGANIRNILDFEQVYPDAKVVRLEQNYRSTQTILDAANGVIANNIGRKEKSLWTESGNGSLIHYRPFETAPMEAEFIADDIARGVKKDGKKYGDFAVLYRTNAQSRLLEEYMVREGIPYQVVGGVNFYARKEIKDILAYLKTIVSGRDDLAVKRILNVPKRSIGATTVGKIETYAAEKGLGFFDALLTADDIPGLGKAAEKIKNFTLMIRSFRSKAEVLSLSDLLEDILDTTGYEEFLHAESETEEEFDGRMENVDELFSKLAAFEQADPEANLASFLEEVALVADIDSVGEDADRVLLMTIHGAKGLEFDSVYLAGMEDGVFPGYITISSGDREELEEERRLAYVAITRARKELTISCAKARMVRGQTQYNPVSRFVQEIPPQLLDNRIPKRRSLLEEPFSDELPFDRDSSYGSSYGDSFGSGSYGSSSYGSGRSYERTEKPEAKKSLFKIPYETPGGRTLPKAKPIPVKKPAITPAKAKPFLAKANAMGMSAKSSPSGGSVNYGVGDRVRHVKFGEGIVKNMEPGPRDTKVTVEFEQCGTKIMYAAFAKLE